MLLEALLLKAFAGLFVAGAIATVVAISFAAIRSWIEQTAQTGETIVLTREDISKAIVIKANIFKKKGLLGKELVAQNVWREQAIDDETVRVFAGRNKVTWKV